MHAVRRPPVTVVLKQTGDRRALRAFLADLGPATAPNDNVLVCAPDNTTSWRVKDSQGAFRHPAQTSGAARRLTVNPIVAFVDDRIVGAPHWLDRLAALAEWDGVGAVAPRSNVASGDELLVGVPYRPYEPAERAAFLAARDGRTGVEPSVATRLGGACLVVPRHVLDAGSPAHLETVASEFNPAALARSLAGSGLMLLVAEDVYLHHPGGPPAWSRVAGSSAPLVSACLIVKNEEANLERCLSSLDGLADEIVIYDTGSTDDTLGIARRHTDRVIEGFWDDDFSRARNAALEACRGEWILWVDADEAIVCDDPGALRTRLQSMSADAEGAIVLIDNLRGSEAATPLTHPACRLFRRSVGHWQGAIHEQVTARLGSPTMSIATASALEELVRITHWGYLPQALEGRDKAARNLRSAFGDLAAISDVGLAERVLSLGRSHQLAGKRESGIELCRIAVELAETDATRRFALRGVIEGLTAAGRYEDALEELAVLRTLDGAALAGYLGGLVHLSAGRFRAALEAFDSVPLGIDVDGFEYGEAFLAGPRAVALNGLRRYDEAADVLLECLRSEGAVDAHLGVLIEAMSAAGRDLRRIYEVLGDDRVRAFAPQLLQIVPSAADECLEAWWELSGGSRILLATASRIAVRLTLERRLVWSERLRAAGLPGACPLLRTATDEELPLPERIDAAALAERHFGDPRATLALRALQTSRARRSVRARASSGTRASRAAVLVIVRDCASLEGLALSALLADLGHTVALVHPLPTEPSSRILDERGVSVHGWDEAPDGPWTTACLALVSYLYASSSFEEVVLGSGTEELASDLARRLPRARIRSLSSLQLDASAVDLFPLDPVPPASARLGACVLANWRGASSAERERLLEEFAPALMRRAGALPFVVIGDDPDGEARRAFPLALQLGPVADPTPWLRASRVAIAPFAEGLAQWGVLAHLCGTPAIPLPAEVEQAESVAQAVLALATNDELWRARAPRGVLSPLRVDRDPLADRAPPPPGATPTTGKVLLVGDVSSHASLARVNRELATRLAARGVDLVFSDVAVLPAGRDVADRLAAAGLFAYDAPDPVALEIRHQWPPDFTPTPHRLVLIQPWEFGAYPAEWVGPIRDVVDELWVPSRFNRAGAIAAGIDPGKVHVVPNGVDTDVFRPDGAPRTLRTAKSTRLLFVGGLIERKGVDVLLEAYLSSFCAADDVCLVVKPFGSGTVYATDSIEPTLRRAVDGGGPEIEIVDDELDDTEMAALYRSCTALVHPFRGEGFALTVAEAMACGLATIVTDGGPCAEYCDETTSWLVRATQTPVRIDPLSPSVGGSWWLEPSRVDLVRAMRAVVRDPAEAARRGARGRERIAATLTWEHAAGIAYGRLAQFCEREREHAR